MARKLKECVAGGTDFWPKMAQEVQILAWAIFEIFFVLIDGRESPITFDLDIVETQFFFLQTHQVAPHLRKKNLTTIDLQEPKSLNDGFFEPEIQETSNRCQKMRKRNPR